MKKTLAFFTLLFGFMAMFAQSGPAFPYQAVVRNAQNQLIKDSTFSIGVEIYQDADLKYSETQRVTTNANGQFTMNIGGGTDTTGSLSDIADWSVGKFKITYHLSEGDIVSENAVSPVPYALQAANNTSGNFLTSDSTVITTIQSDIAAAIGKEKTDSNTLASRIDALVGATMDCDDVKECIKDTLSQYTPTTDLCDVLGNCQFSEQSLEELLQGLTEQISNLQSQVNAQNQKIDSLSNLPHGGDTPGTFVCGTYKVKDVDNNTYNTVQIGNQCWMKENLRTTTHQYGNVWTKTDVDSAIYGLYYDWAAVMQGESGNKVQGICPTGWHVPSDAEWDTLTSYVNSVADYKCEGTNNYIAKALASKTGWNASDNSCAVGNNLEHNNATGFSAVPAGYYSSNNATCFNFGDYAFLWSATEGESGKVLCRELNRGAYQVHSTNEEKNYGFSVRCVRNADTGGSTPSTPATMSCEEVMDCLGDTLGRLNAMIEAQGAEIEVLNGTVTAQGNTITTQGQTIEALNSTIESQGETIASQGNTIDSLSNIVDSLSNLTYGTPFTCGTDSIKDIDNNWYHTIQFGEQCWMKENLRTTKYADNTPIANGTSSSFSVAYWYYPNNDAGNKATYGLLYNWKAVMNGVSSTDNNPSGVQGICPNGWHVPSDAEWTQLTRFVKSQPAYVCAGCSGSDNDWYTYCIAKALASTTGWGSDSETCVVGDTTRSNNATGFSAMPAGFYDGDYNLFSTYTCFWSTTEDYDSRSYGRAILTYNNYVDRQYYKGSNGFSVRCVRDTETNGNTPSTPATMSCDEVMNCMGDTLGRLNAMIEAQGAEIETLNSTVETLSTTVTAQEETIATQSTEIETLNTTVASQGNTIDSLSNIVDSLSNLPHSGGNTPTEVADGQPCPDAATVSDIDGNTYNTVKIGNQCWTKENLRTKLGTDGDYGYPARADNDTVTYGRLYAWTAMMNGAQSTDYPNGSAPKDTMVRGICPTGWHVPSDAEWDTLTNYVNSVAEYRCGGSDRTIANALSASTGWTDTNACCAGYSSATINKTGFAAVPAGKYYSEFNFFGNCAFFWSATEYGSSALRRRLFSVDTDVDRYHENKDAGLSVRCLRDAGIGGGNTPSTPATMSCEEVMECMGDTLNRLNARIESQSAEIETLNGTVTSQANTINSLNRIVDSLSNHTPDTPGSDTTASSFNCGTDKVKDVDSNEYNTILIGNQCWMKEDLRTTTLRYGQAWPANNVCLYDWAAAMQVSGANGASITVGDKHQGICPAGWHVPSDADWDALTYYVSSQSEYQCGGESTNIAKALSSKTGWNSSNIECAVGNTPEDNNTTGFTAVPAGGCYGESLGFSNVGNGAYMWSSTQKSDGKAWYRLLGYGKSSVVRSDGNKGNGYSVRCVRN